jgi:hypothetical protein
MERHHDPETAQTGSAEDDRLRQAQDAKLVLQGIIDRLGPDLAHRPLEVVRERLVRAIAEAGLPEQPHAWVDSAVVELAGGRGLVMDARFEAGPRRPGPSDPQTH